MSIRKLEVSNKRICKFYQDNPAISFETVNLLLVDLFEQLIFDVGHAANPSIHNQLVSIIQTSTQDIQANVNSLKEFIQTSQSSIETLFSRIKEDYIREIQDLTETHSTEKLAPLLETHNQRLIDKTAHMIGELIPKSQNQLYSKIDDSIKSFQRILMEDTHALLQSKDTNSVKEFIASFDMKSSVLLQNVQQPLYSFISSSEERINSNINSLKENQTNIQQLQTKIVTDIGDMVCKQRDAQSNQQVQDKQLISILNRLYTTGEICTQPASGGILLKRIRKSNVFFENRDTDQNVGADEIHHFLQMVEEHHSNGIFISQKSGISTKKNFQIEIHNNNVIVFIHACDYSPTKIESAIDIIDHLYSRLRQSKPGANDDCPIPKEVLDTINNEYQLFLTQKNAVIDVFKESQKKILAQVDELRFPALDRFLSTKYSAPIQKPGFKCDLCKSFSGNNLKALAAHKRGCIKKNGNTIVHK